MVCLRLYRLGDGLVLGRLGMCLFLYCGSSWLVGMIFFFWIGSVLVCCCTLESELAELFS
jgi:hypothetical protein